MTIETTPGAKEGLADRTITDETVEEARKLIGVWLRRDVHWPSVAYPLSALELKRWAMYSMGDDNPLWCDIEYGKRSSWGTNVAPPTWLLNVDSSIIAPGLRGIQWIDGGKEWQIYRPVRVGDTLTAQARVIDVLDKRGTRVPRFLIQVGETTYYNQRDEKVARIISNIMRTPRARAEGALRLKAQEPYRYTDEEINLIDGAYEAEFSGRRGSEIRYWEDVSVGDPLPKIVRGPLTLVDIVTFYAGRRTVYNALGLAFRERRRHPANVLVNPVTNVPSHPAAGHFESATAAGVGIPAVYDNAWQRYNWLCSQISGWMGDHGLLRRFKVRLDGMNYVGDATWFTGSVVEKRVENGMHLVKCEMVGTNQRDQRTTWGMAEVELRTRSVEGVA